MGGSGSTPVPSPRVGQAPVPSVVSGGEATAGASETGQRAVDISHRLVGAKSRISPGGLRGASRAWPDATAPGHFDHAISQDTSTGYLLLGSTGGVYNFGTTWDGSLNGKAIDGRIVGITSTPTGGYYLVTSRGAVYNFGTAWHVSVVARGIDADIVGMAVDPKTGGYWLASTSGAVYNFRRFRVFRG